MTDYQIAIDAISGMLNDPDVLVESFKRSAYEEGFRRYYLKFVPAFDALEHLYSSVVDKDTLLENMADAYVAKAKEMYESVPKRKREVFFINMALAMAGFVYPSIAQYGGGFSKPLTDILQKKWKDEFPKSNITPSTYEEIEQGFHKKWCYITTAACQYRGMEDDCEELDLLRAYRDTYMMSRPEGGQLILDYYDVAPSIVKHINSREDAGQIYDDLWNEYINVCIEDIREGKYEECLERYSDMVMNMKKKYFHVHHNVKDISRDF